MELNVDSLQAEEEDTDTGSQYSGPSDHKICQTDFVEREVLGLKEKVRQVIF